MENICEIEGCTNPGRSRGLNILFCNDCYEAELDTCTKCHAGKMIDDSVAGGTRCNNCGSVVRQKS